MYSPYRSSPPEVLLRKGVLKIWSKFTGELPNRSVVSIKMLCNSIEIALRHGCFPVNMLHIFRTSFYKNTYGHMYSPYFKKRPDWIIKFFRSHETLTLVSFDPVSFIGILSNHSSLECLNLKDMEKNYNHYCLSDAYFLWPFKVLLMQRNVSLF